MKVAKCPRCGQKLIGDISDITQCSSCGCKFKKRAEQTYTQNNTSDANEEISNNAEHLSNIGSNNTITKSKPVKSKVVTVAKDIVHSSEDDDNLKGANAFLTNKQKILIRAGWYKGLVYIVPLICLVILLTHYRSFKNSMKSWKSELFKKLRAHTIVSLVVHISIWVIAYLCMNTGTLFLPFKWLQDLL